MPDNRRVMRFRLAMLPALALVVLAAPFVSAEAQPLTDGQIEIIRQNCTQAQQILQRLQRNEAATRVNRGREYESTLRLMASFNGRVALNKLNVPTLTAATSEMEKNFADFRAHYISYDAKVKNILKLRCNEQPVTFYDQLTLVREARAEVAQDIKDIDASLDKYQKAVSDLRVSLSDGGSAQ